MELVPSIIFYKINGITRIAAIVTIVIISHLTSIPTGLSVPSIETLTPNANISIKNNVYNINANVRIIPKYGNLLYLKHPRRIIKHTFRVCQEKCVSNLNITKK